MRWSAFVLLFLGAAPVQETPDRSPHALALTADGRYAITANATSDTASLVDLAEGKLLCEVPAGKRPFHVAFAAGRAIVTNHRAGSITVLDVAPPKLTVAATLDVGHEPRGVTMDASRAFVALSGEDSIAVVDLKSMKVASRIAVGQEPWHLAIAGDRIAVGCARSQEVRILDAAKLETVGIVKMRGPNLRRLTPSPDGAWAYVCNIAERGAGTTRQNIDRGWVVGNRLSRVPLKQEGLREAIALDIRTDAVADCDEVAVAPDGATLAIAAGGTQELLLFRLPLPFVASGGPGDLMDTDLRRDRKRFRRVDVGGRPTAAAFTPDGKSIVVANYLSNAVQIVDFDKAEVTKTIPLGGPEKQSLVRRGEVTFYDARRSFGSWYSCHTCHVDGHTNGSSYDTLNDGKYGNLKKVASLRGIAKTAPYTWHGWQPELRTAIEHSMIQTMQGSKPNAGDLDGIVAFISAFDFVAPKPPADEAAVKRGAAVFKAKRCATCHAPPDYTTAQTVEVGLESPGDAYKGFNPPSLKGVGTRGPWLHDGRAKTLEQLFRKHHQPSKVTQEADPTDEELRDLIEFLKSL